jgi:hypothetical protein
VCSSERDGDPPGNAPVHEDVPDLLSAGPTIDDGGSEEKAKGVGRRGDGERVERRGLVG